MTQSITIKNSKNYRSNVNNCKKNWTKKLKLLYKISTRINSIKLFNNTPILSKKNKSNMQNCKSNTNNLKWSYIKCNKNYNTTQIPTTTKNSHKNATDLNKK